VAMYLPPSFAKNLAMALTSVTMLLRCCVFM
jgi:hypothetical protein